MSSSDSNDRTKLPVSVSHQIDHLCDKFEADFADDDLTRIENYLAEIKEF